MGLSCNLSSRKLMGHIAICLFPCEETEGILKRTEAEGVEWEVRCSRYKSPASFLGPFAAPLVGSITRHASNPGKLPACSRTSVRCLTADRCRKNTPFRTMSCSWQLRRGWVVLIMFRHSSMQKVQSAVGLPPKWMIFHPYFTRVTLLG